MSGVIFPDYVERFIGLVGRGLAFFNCALEPCEDPKATARNYTPSDRLSDEDARLFSITGVAHPTFLLVHRTARSKGRPVGEYRARARTVLPAQVQEFVRGKIDTINRYATLGALVAYEDGIEVASQCLVDEVETKAGVMAASLVHAAPSIMISLQKALTGEGGDPVHAMSRWSDLDLEQIHYDYAHLGVGKLKRSEWSMAYGQRRLILAAVHNNPYWGGGLLATLWLPGEIFQRDGEPVNLNDLNALCFLVDDIPTFGAWCRDGDNVVFVTFAPNFLKELPDFTDHLIHWAGIRAVQARHMTRLVIETAPDQHSGESAA
jgi:hypothetical protein